MKYRTEGEFSEFVLRFRALPGRERSIMYELLFAGRERENVAREWDLSMDRLEAIEDACMERLGLTKEP